MGFAGLKSTARQSCISSEGSRGNLLPCQSSFSRLPVFLGSWPLSSIFEASNIGPSPSHATSLWFSLFCLPPPLLSTFVVTLSHLDDPQYSLQGQLITKLNSTCNLNSPLPSNLTSSVSRDIDSFGEPFMCLPELGLSRIIYNNSAWKVEGLGGGRGIYTKRKISKSIFVCLWSV